MAKMLTATLLVALVIGLVAALRYLSRPKHLEGRNVGSAANHFSPQDPGSQGANGGRT
jgi:hypothetical protein